MALRKSEKSGYYVEINKNVLRNFVNEVGGPVAAEVLSIATDVANAIRRDAPVAPEATHGRAPGYLKANVRLTAGSNLVLGPYIKVTSGGKSPQGFNYPAYYNWHKRNYMQAGRQAYAVRAATPKTI